MQRPTRPRSSASTSISARPRCRSPAPARRKPEGQVFSGRAEVRHIPVDRLGDYWPLEFAAGRPAVGAGQSQQGRDRRRRGVCAERAGQRHGRDQGRSPGRPARLSRHDGALHAAHARAAGRVGQGALRGRHAAFRRGERRLRRPQDGRRHHRPDRARRPAPQYAAIRMPITGSAQDVIRFLARPKLGLPRTCSTITGGWAARWRSTCRSRFPLLNSLAVADLDIKAEASLSHFSLQGRARRRRPHATPRRASSTAARSSASAARASSTAVPWRSAGASCSAPRCRSAAATSSRARCRRRCRQGGFPVARALRHRAARHDAHLSGGDQRHERGGRPLRHQGAPRSTWRRSAGPRSRHRGPGQDDDEACRRRQAHDHRFRRPRQRPERPRARCASAATMPCSRSRCSSSRSARPTSRSTGSAARAASSCRCAARSLELPRVRAMMKARDDLAAKDPAGPPRPRRASTRMTLQIQQVLTERGTLGYINGRLDLIGRAHRLRPTCRSAPARARPSASRRPAQGRKLFLYVADFGQMLKEAGWLDGLVSGYLHIEGQSTTPSPASPLDGFLKLGPYPAAEGDAARQRRHAELDHRRAEPRRQRPAAVRQSRGQGRPRSAIASHIRNGRTSGQSIGLTAAGLSRSRQRHGAAARHRRAGLRAEQPAVERAAARPAADRRQGWRPVRHLLSALTARSTTSRPTST